MQNDPDICEVLRDMFRSEGYIVDVVGNGKDAVQYVSGVSYGAILLDMRLPDRDSLSLLEVFKELHSTVPVTVLTVFHDVGTIANAFERGAWAYILMP